MTTCACSYCAKTPGGAPDVAERASGDLRTPMTWPPAGRRITPPPNTLGAAPGSLLRAKALLVCGTASGSFACRYSTTSAHGSTGRCDALTIVTSSTRARLMTVQSLIP